MQRKLALVKPVSSPARFFVGHNSQGIEMKKYFLVFALACSPVYADDSKACGQAASLAKLMMEKRQAGASMAQMAAVVDHPLILAQLRRAFNVPMYATEAMQQRAIIDFENEEYKHCLDLWKEMRRRGMVKEG